MASQESHGYSAVRALSDLSQNGRHEGKLVKGVGAPSDVTSGQASSAGVSSNAESRCWDTNGRYRDLLKLPTRRSDRRQWRAGVRYWYSSF